MCIQPKSYSKGKKPARTTLPARAGTDGSFRYVLGGIIISRPGIKVFLFILFLIVSGCKTLEKPSEFVESLRNPTSFPEMYFPTAKDIDEIVKENELAKDENIKVIPIGENKSTSVHLIQVRENAEMDAHFHKSHDEIVYIKSGSGVLELNGTRYGIKDGMLLVIPRRTVHKFVNTGGRLNIAISFFSPPFDGEDIELIKVTRRIKKKKKTIYDKAMKKQKKGKEDEDGEKKKWFSFWKGDEEKVELGKGEEVKTGEAIEEQKILVLTDEGRQRIKEVQQKISEEERRLIEKVILNEKLKVLQKLKDDGLIDQEELDAKRSEIIGESKL
ncbi:MAG: cupin domain-containing protein [Candidatus Scalinduaceae bacterium]